MNHSQDEQKGKFEIAIRRKGEDLIMVTYKGEWPDYNAINKLLHKQGWEQCKGAFYHNMQYFSRKVGKWGQK